MQITRTCWGWGGESDDPHLYFQGTTFRNPKILGTPTSPLCIEHSLRDVLCITIIFHSFHLKLYLPPLVWALISFLTPLTLLPSPPPPHEQVFVDAPLIRYITSFQQYHGGLQPRFYTPLTRIINYYCVNKVMLPYDWLLQPLFMALIIIIIDCFRSKLFDFASPIIDI